MTVHKQPLTKEEIYDLLQRATLAGETGDYARADELYTIIRAQLPNIASIASNHGNVLLKLDRIPDAIAAYRAALVTDPAHAGYISNLADAWCALGNGLLKQGKAAEAEAAYRQAISSQPRAEYYSNLSNALVQGGRFDAATEALHRAIALQPDFAPAHANLGNVLARIGRMAESIDAYNEAIRLNPDFAVAWSDLGYVYLQMGRSYEALAAFNRAVSIDPDYSDAQLYRALALLRLGDSEQGWQAYEWRWKTYRQIDRVLPAASLKRWNGEPLPGKRLLVWQEQGYGDTIQFSRYAADLAARGAHVILLVDKSLEHLMQSVPGIAQVLTDVRPDYDADFHVPLMSLPGLLRQDFGGSAAPIPYIYADLALKATWQEKLAGLKRFRVGLVWAGDPRPHDAAAHQMDSQRSLRLADLAPLAQMQGVDFVSLQKGAAAQQADEIQFGAPILNVSDELHNFSDTAAVIANLDLVISVDTSVAHLAGALGKPVWILSRLGGCWRWLEERDDTPWYPQARLFRQVTAGDWASVVTRLTAELQKKI